MTTARRSLPYPLLALLLAVLSLPGCSLGPPDPKPVPRDRPLPSCDALVPALISLGMGRLDPQPSPSSDLTPAQRACSFEPSERPAPPAILSATVSVALPRIDPDRGVTVKRWGEMWVDKPCEGLQRPVSSIAKATFCYTAVSADSGSAGLVGLPDDIGIEVRVHWWDPEADQTTLRADAEQKAEALATHLIALL
ncbi:hypothetical protein ACN27G_04515 [Plantactinospora sp. WMMB334]|uniref:hypothetical protein n=1 Tax=Plantactinospora sp. WMMB334 TaxID=3404119 RepID=UPI003B9591CF